MSENTVPATQVIAVNELRWCVFRLPDGKLQLDMGAIAWVLTRQEFAALCQLTQKSPEDTLAGTVNQPDTGKGVYFCSHHQTVGLLFNDLFLRFTWPEFNALNALCQQANLKLGPLSERLIPQPVKRPGFSPN